MEETPSSSGGPKVQINSTIHESFACSVLHGISVSEKRAKRVDDLFLPCEHHRLPVDKDRADAELDSAVARNNRRKHVLGVEAAGFAAGLRHSALPFENARGVNEIDSLHHECHRRHYAATATTGPSGKHGMTRDARVGGEQATNWNCGTILTDRARGRGAAVIRAKLWPMPYPTIPYGRDHPADPVAAARAFLETARQRRTVRTFSSEPVPLEVLRLSIAAAASAPSGANQQPWTFVVVTNPEVKRRIREGAEKEEYENYHGRMPEEWLQVLAPLQTDWHKEFLEIAPALIVVFKQEYGLDAEGRHVTHYYVNESVGIACGFLLAALNAAGLATLTHTPSPMGFLREILGRPKNEKPYLLIPVGYPSPDCRVPDIHKKPLDEVLRTVE